MTGLYTHYIVCSLCDILEAHLYDNVVIVGRLGKHVYNPRSRKLLPTHQFANRRISLQINRL